MKYNDNWYEKVRTDHYHTIANESSPFDIKVVQFGPPRTGTTVVYQLLCSLMRESTKTHSPIQVINFEPDYWVCTCRDPRDTICSHWRIDANVTKANFDTIKMGIKSLDYYFQAYSGYFSLYEPYTKKDNVIWLKYEKYYNDFDNIFDAFERRMDIKIDGDMRNTLKEQHSIKHNKEFSNNYNNFKDYDNSDLSGLHGNHIFTGEPGSWKMLVEEKYHRYMNDLMRPYLQAWKYEE